MRIVVLTPTLPLPFGHADARWLYVILSELASRQIDVTCVAATQAGEDDVTQAASLAERQGYELRHLPFATQMGPLRRKFESAVRPFSYLARVDGIRSILEYELGRGYDVLHVEHLFSAWLATHIPRSVTYLHHLEVVDWEARPDLSRREQIELIQMRRASRRLLATLHRVIVASTRLQREVSSFHGHCPVPVVPVALDPALYPIVCEPTDPRVGVIGSMDWYPSRSAAERVLTQLWGAIHASYPSAELLVAGWNADRYLSRFFPLEGATLLGQVARPEEFFSRVTMLLYPPPRGSGMKIKVLEAMAYGVPVVSNSEGLEGFDFAADIPAATGETNEELVRSVLGLLADGSERERIRRAGRHLVETHFSPVPAVDRLLSAYDSLGLLT